MLRSFRELRGFAIRATDGRVGQVSDVYVDDRDWRVRYCVVDSGRWFRGRYVLIGSRPLSVSDGTRRELWVRLSKGEVNRSPKAAIAAQESHVRSCQTLLGHRLDAKDGTIGRVDDFLLDEKAWLIRHLVVDTANWNRPAGQRVLVDPKHVESVSAPNGNLSLALTRAEVLTAPIYQATSVAATLPPLTKLTT